MEDRTADSPIVDFLDALASGQSTPGGGGAAALTGSEAAALLSMVINFTVGKKKYAAVEEAFQGYLTRTEALRSELLALADDDVAAFNGVAACYGMPKATDDEKAARTAAMQAAPKPLSILTTASPGAQLLSMPRSAENPPAPVP